MKDTEKTIDEFGKCPLSLCHMLHDDTPLNEIHRLFIENHLELLQMAYRQWKRHNANKPL
jgi:hypothetical protein